MPAIDRFNTQPKPLPPRILYGTAWKENDTQRLTELAIEAGFRGIDTANQRKHYHEAAVGEAVAAAIKRGLITRADLFLQSKFTFQRGQDHRLPYDPSASISDQVIQSFDSSLEHLQTTYLDSYLLHGPAQRMGLTNEDWAAWKSMEQLYEQGRVRAIGVSNVSFEQLRDFCQNAHISPHFVQNRCYATQGWDRQVRELCRSHHLFYQGFSLLTANVNVLNQPTLIEMARRYRRSVAQIVFRFALDVEMIPLTGTSNPNHMQADLDILDIRLEPEDLRRIEYLGNN